jgi:hypothetical protein
LTHDANLFGKSREQRQSPPHVFLSVTVKCTDFSFPESGTKCYEEQKSWWRPPSIVAAGAAHRGTGRRLFDLFRGPHWTVLSFVVLLPEPVCATDEVRVHVIDDDWQGHAAYGVDGTAVFVIRPDSHLSLVSRDDAVAPVLRYLQDFAMATVVSR